MKVMMLNTPCFGVITTENGGLVTTMDVEHPMFWGYYNTYTITPMEKWDVEHPMFWGYYNKRNVMYKFISDVEHPMFWGYYNDKTHKTNNLRMLNTPCFGVITTVICQ